MDETDKLQSGIVVVTIADTQVDVVARNVDGVVLDPDVDRHLREGIEEHGQPGRQPQFGQRKRHADDKTRPQAPFQHAPSDRRDVSKGTRGLRIDRVAGVGQRDAVAGAQEQLLAKPALEVSDLLADRGRGTPSSVAASVKLEVRAATSNALTAFSGGSRSMRNSQPSFSFATLTILPVEEKDFFVVFCLRNPGA